MNKKIICVLFCIFFIVCNISFPTKSVIFSIDDQIVFDRGSQTTITINSDLLPGEWAKTFGGNGCDLARSVRQTNDGGFILTGNTDSYGAVGGSDIILLKTDSNGNLEWYRLFSGKKYDIGRSVIQTSDLGFIIVGETNSFSSRPRDIWVIKTDSYGYEQWSKIYDMGKHEVGRFILQTNDGGYIILGNMFDGDSHIWLIKTDYNGNKIWERLYHSWGTCIQQTNDGGYIIAGDASDNIYLMKTDIDGDFLWSNKFGGKYNSWATYVQQTNDDGFIIAGNSELYNFDDFAYLVKTDNNGNKEWEKDYYKVSYSVCYVEQMDDGGYIFTGSQNNNFLLTKIDAEGNELWRRMIDGNYLEDCYSAQATSDGGYILAGRTYDTLPNPNYYQILLVKIIYGPPDKPEPPIGPTSGSPGESYQYTANTIDPDGDQIYYRFNWGDGTESDWLGPYNSGEDCLVAHNWSNTGNYNIRAQAKDTWNLTSVWSDPLSVSMPKNKAINTPFLQFLENHPRLFPILGYVISRE